MNKHYRIRRLGEIVHAELGSRFVISLAHLMPLWAEVLVECSAAKLRRVLIEGTTPDRQMEPLDAYAHGDFLSGLDRPGVRIAFCLYGYEPDALTKHFVRVASSGASTVQFFYDIDRAITWVGM